MAFGLKWLKLYVDITSGNPFTNIVTPGEGVYSSNSQTFVMQYPSSGQVPARQHDEHERKPHPKRTVAGYNQERWFH
jgi:hypothetical protein